MAVEKKSYSRIPETLPIPNLIENQIKSYTWFREEGLKELLENVFHVRDFTGSRLELRFRGYYFKPPEKTPEECRELEITYQAPLFVKVELVVKETGEVKEQDIFMGDIPLMTVTGTFIINGAERVVVSQLVRSPGVYFTLELDVASEKELAYAKLIPNQGAWLEFETSPKNILFVKVDRKRKLPATNLLRALGYGDDPQLRQLFPKEEEWAYIEPTMEKEPQVNSEQDALIDFYKRMRPGDPPNQVNARALLNTMFLEPQHYDLGKVGRYKLNKRLSLDTPLTITCLTKEDIAEIVRHLILVNEKQEEADEIDHLGNRRVRSVGELLYNQFRIGLLRMARAIRERMTLVDAEAAVPAALINIRPVVAAVREFFGGSQLSQFMDQINPLSELTHKRRLSALGPGGLSRERAGFDVRDVHYSHYGRICPIETPEGPNIGLLASLATYSKINEFGFIETPYRRVVRQLPSNSPELVGCIVREDIKNVKRKLILREGEEITPEVAKRLAKLNPRNIKLRPFVSQEVEYLSADKEQDFIIAQANVNLDEKGHFLEEKVEARQGKNFFMEGVLKVDYMDVSPKQIVSVSTALIPFLEHDDANRALMGSNMQRQAVPLVKAEHPLVSTAIEQAVARDTGQVIFSPCKGVVTSATGKEVVIADEEGKEHIVSLVKFSRSNQSTCINYRPRVAKGERVEEGQVIAESYCSDGGEVALGQNVLCAFMSWEGYNYEDAIVVSEELVREDKFTSVHIEKYEIEARDTKLGAEEITRDIPNVGEDALRNLDEKGIIRLGADVGPGDILVGKISPKGETELTAEEKLLRAIFGEKARDVKDTSLRVPHGGRGKVITVRVISKEKHHEMPAGVNTIVRVWVAQKRKIMVGDKVAGRHGNKGVISKILPVEDIPFLPDGTPVAVILNPLGVPSRMNLGQVLEAHLGIAAHTLGFEAVSPVFDGAKDRDIEDALGRAWLAREAVATRKVPGKGLEAVDMEKFRAWLVERRYDPDSILLDKTPGIATTACLRIWLEKLGVKSQKLEGEELKKAAAKVAKERGIPTPISGKTLLYDGRSGEAFQQPVTVGHIFLMKLIHLAEDKIHARSTGPYSLITQQPLGGKAQFGGQRFGEMEVWALESYGAAYNLREVLTIKSDDVVGRVKAYEAVMKGEDISELGVPESFRVLVKELQSLGLAVEVLPREEVKPPFLEEAKPKLFAEEKLEEAKPKLFADEKEETEKYA